MKRSFLLAAASFLCMMINPVKAQITVTSADLPVIGTMVINAVDTITPVSPGNAGTNQLWDFSSLVASRYDTILYLQPQGVPNYPNYPESNIVYDVKDYDCEGCIPLIANAFVRHETDGMWPEGVEYQMGMPGGFTLNLHQKWMSDYRMVPLPMNYNDHMEQTVTYEAHSAVWFSGVMMDTSKSVHNVTYTTDVDASGTLITPYNTFQVLRVKEVSVDQYIHYAWTGNGWEVTDQGTDSPNPVYRWYTNDFFEVGSCSGDGKSSGSGFTFFKSETYVGLDEPVKHVLLEISPNPADNMINLRTNSKIEKIEIINLSGAVVQTENNTTNIDISRLKPGMYLLKAKSNAGVETGKFIKQ
jgi:hypothetical protein